MTPRRSDFTERRDKILSIVVDYYTRTVTPVSSAFIAREYFPDLSSATIRNILAELEDEGFLSHPHTSAGRVPTQQGYRYYVDNLMNEIKLLKEEEACIQTEYAQGVLELECLLEKTSEVISNATHYTSIVSVDGEQSKIFCRGISFVAGYPEFHDFRRIQHLLHVLEEKERLLGLINRELERRVEVFIGKEIQCDDMENCSLVVSQYQKKGGPSGRIAILGPTRMDYEKVVSTLEYVSELVSNAL